MEINLDEFKAPGKTNTRVSTGQSFTGIKFRDNMFILSNELFDKIGLATLALKVMINPTSKQVALVPVANNEGSIFKRTDKTGVEKSKGFTSSVIQTALKETGLLAANTEDTQYLDLATATTKSGATVYVIVAGGGKKKKNEGSPSASVGVEADNSQSPTPATSNTQEQESEFPDIDVVDQVEDTDSSTDEFSEQF